MRKFDIRVFGLAQIVEGAHFRGYFYKEGYIRTSCYKYDCSDLSDAEIHLTNDAIQQKCEDYAKYEPGNKISFKDFATYLKNYRKVDFDEIILPQMRDIVAQSLEAFWLRIQEINGFNPGNRSNIINQFEMFGYDFMIDEDLNVILIEVNTNPCLDTTPCPLLNRLIT